ncbi:peptide chain release factor 2 [Candidatus Sulfurimonas marisnigri]|uniref:Peptide chain release factor 2 n=1 Tax=Candidatus Sulfurimonas marisnigri TaxID=2740405 RepID=A0A7S7RQZ2_9BACT|nr:peptide chain release factor 2 [Candidatus Sulfurimonas marisnigri]QOY54960.1 peptide chain release factor 2 [Candidatus Sulfurimonas marisnigri]
MDNYEYTELLKNLTIKMDNITGVVEPDKLKARLNEIEELENNQEFWDDASNAANVQQEKTKCQRKLDKYYVANNAILDAKELYEMAKEESDEESINECFDSAQELKQQILNMEIEVLLSGEMDSKNAILSIHPGAGGTESQDWAEMLLRMYKRFAERRGFSVEVLDYQSGEEAGIKDVSILIKGENAYGYLKVENGIHRLVRISPFDSNAKRHTSFSSVMVSPEVDDDINIVVEDKDIRIDTYRSSGAGGQHVNKTESAIRITHIATNVVVQCQNDRSQHKNKATAMKMLKSRLYELELEAQKAELAGVSKSEIGWGHQIRSYVMQPYQQVKDTRSNEAYSNISGILDGDMGEMIEGVLIAQNRS